MKYIAILIALLPACSHEPPPHTAAPIDSAANRHAIGRMLDDWHQAASQADAKRYFAHFADDAVFLGTDASERWTLDEFRAFAMPHFNKKKAWSFRARRRDVTLAGKRLAWFDEDLITPNLGPARGSGVVRRGDSPTGWRIAQYNLTITLPNERFAEVRALLAGDAPCAR